MGPRVRAANRKSAALPLPQRGSARQALPRYQEPTRRPPVGPSLSLLGAVEPGQRARLCRSPGRGRSIRGGVSRSEGPVPIILISRALVGVGNAAELVLVGTPRQRTSTAIRGRNLRRRGSRFTPFQAETRRGVGIENPALTSDGGPDGGLSYLWFVCSRSANRARWRLCRVQWITGMHSLRPCAPRSQRHVCGRSAHGLHSRCSPPGNARTQKVRL